MYNTIDGTGSWLYAMSLLLKSHLLHSKIINSLKDYKLINKLQGYKFDYIEPKEFKNQKFVLTNKH